MTGLSPRFTYRVDGNDVITYVSEAWVEFARQNGAATLDEASVVGRSIWDLIAHAPTRELYKLVFRKVRVGKTVVLPFRCDAPRLRRYMQLSLTPRPGAAIEIYLEPYQ